jgi:hypothetical protein
MFDRQIWSIKKCPDCHCAEYYFTWDSPQIYSICGCGIKVRIGEKVQILVNQVTEKEKKQ